MQHPQALSIAANQFCNVECQIQRLASVEARVAHCFVTRVEIFIAYGLCTAKTLCDIVAGELDVDAAWPCAFCTVGLDKASDLTNDVVKVAGLATIWSSECVGVHWVACPHNRMSSVAYST